MLTNEKKDIIEWVNKNEKTLSDWNQTIWNYAEPAWREYKSSAWYVHRLREEGFEVEEQSGDMPTAFCATWKNGTGPVIGGYAEYDAVPGNNQAADTVQKSREGLSPYAGGHTDPHSALGIGSLGGFLAAKAMMEKHDIKGTLKFFGEPAEKLRGSKPIHAAKGYYDDLDAAISFHPFYMLPLCNTTRWDTHCAVAYSVMYTFTCDEPQTWLSSGEDSPIPAAHAAARAPGATDAVVTMYSLSKMYKEHMLSNSMGWSVNETILNTGQATADNIPAQMSQIYYFIRVPDIEKAQQVIQVLDQNAESAASAAHCNWKREWVTKSRAGLANHTMAEATYQNLKHAGAPQFEGKAVDIAREIQKNLGFDPMEEPYLDEIETLVPPQEAERKMRESLPAWQQHFTSDDYTEYCWHAPTVRLYIGRPALKSPKSGYAYPDWVMNAMGGIRECIDPMIYSASKTVGMMIIDLLTNDKLLDKAKEEFKERTGGGINGAYWTPPLCDYEPPIDYRWPEYVTTARGENHWVIPARGDE
ncbi:amidohydrolase [Salicibibacter cibi]|uniref:Amidohydrolase n=1 Tax=Salicibibacter cibi TaxID=2743001 RepID=A0A7T7CF20_9BACI|nr:amidohydrolase [Salicibibacter cibi]QQK79638.1 amidohydrolase [Salicibibacter cibi]